MRMFTLVPRQEEVLLTTGQAALAAVFLVAVILIHGEILTHGRIHLLGIIYQPPEVTRHTVATALRHLHAAAIQAVEAVFHEAPVAAVHVQVAEALAEDKS